MAPTDPGAKTRKPKPVDPDAEERRAHYEKEKKTKNALKAEKTLKAVGSATVSPLISRSATPKSGPKPKSTKPSKHGDVKSGKPKPHANGDKAKPHSPKEKAHLGKEKAKSSEAKTVPKPKVATAENAAENGDHNGTKCGKNASGSANNPKNGAKADGVTSSPNSAERTKPKAQPGKTKAPKPKPASQEPASSAKGGKSKDQADVKAPKAAPAAPEIKLPPGIFKYEPAKEPPLTYDTMDQYFNEMCYNLFLEEKMSVNTSPKAIMNASDFELEWFADNDKRHKQYKLKMLLTPEFLDRFVAKKMQKLKKSPFSAGQSLILMLGDAIPWYGNIVLADPVSSKARGKKGKPRGKFAPDSSPKLLEVIVELYKWNKMPLPISCDVRHFKVLPVSIPVSRVFTAMSRISNPRFIKMLLGKEPIRQISFRNYLKFTRDTFNDSQKVAVQSVLNNSITVLQGPPGTGKTSTIYEIVLQLLENLNTFPILVVAASNIAIDNIAEKLLAKHGNSILRIVSAEKEPEYNRDHPLASICLHHKVFDGLPPHLQDTFRELRRPNSNVSPTQFKKLLTAQIGYSDKLIASSRVIFTTTVVAGGNQLKPVPKMPVVIMDEATQSSEPTTLIPLSMQGVEKFVFVGDQKQLSSFSQVPNLSLSLFERILSNGSYKTPHMLDTQYRMHPSISEFSRHKFYDGALKDGITADDRKMDGIPADPVLFWDTCGNCPESTVFSRFREDSGLTYANEGEIDYVQKVLTHLLVEKGIAKSDIGVVTPYRGQRDKLSSTLVQNELINPEKLEVHVEIDREDFFNDSKPVTIHTVSGIMIASIDAFQGREKNFLVMSCVRSNKANKIGFLSDSRRMNVALTRAKYGLILVGDVHCLKASGGLWAEYIETLEAKDAILREPDFRYV